MPDRNASIFPGFILSAGLKLAEGRFTLIRKLGQGGMGVVWLARDERLGVDVALKFLPAEIYNDSAALEDLRREALKSRGLSHPNIIRIYDFHEHAGEPPFISMEFVEGSTLHALRGQQEQRIFGWEFIQPLIRQLCEALDYAHSEKVIHRDLKPANVMLDQRGRVKLADFGIAAAASDSMSRISLRGNTSGTPGYMSPQQMDGRAPRVSDDVYSLGAMIYELLTSRAPFHRGDIAYQAHHVPPDAMEDRLVELGLTNTIPPDVAALVMACLAKEPEQRPVSARAVAEWLGMASPGSSPIETQEPQVIFEEQPAAPRNRWLWPVLSSTVILIFLAIGTFVFLKGKGSSRKQDEANSISKNAAAGKTTEVADSESGFVSLFNGRDLTEWEGDSRFWSVQEGAITGERPATSKPEKNTFLFWTGGELGDFELRLSCRMPTGNSGVQFRSTRLEGWTANGYQAEVISIPKPPEGKTWWFGSIVEETAPVRPGSGAVLSECGQKVRWDKDGKRVALGSVGKTPEQLFSAYRPFDWNDYTIIARGSHIVLQINGQTTAELTDDDLQHRSLSGLLAFQLHNNGGKPMKVQFKDIRLKRLSDSGSSSKIETQDIAATSIIGSWISPDKGSRWNFAANGVFSYSRDGQQQTGRWVQDGSRISVDAKSVDGKATLVRRFEIISLTSTEASIAMNGERPYTWKKLLPPRGESEAGFTSMFNGRDLTGWAGIPKYWSVKDGAIVGKSDMTTPNIGNTFLVWQGGQVSDFEFVCQYKLEANNLDKKANSGIQFRAFMVDPAKFTTTGYQAELDPGTFRLKDQPDITTINGAFLTDKDDRPGNFWINVGQKVVIHAAVTGLAPVTVTGSLGPVQDYASLYRSNDWNEVRIVAVGNHIQIFINGKQSVDAIDESNRYTSGLLGLQLQAPQQFKTLYFKDLKLRALESDPIASTFALARQPSIPFAGTLPGTIWLASDSDGEKYCFQFSPNGVLNYESERGIQPSGKWQQEGKGISIDINDGFTLFSGTISGSKMQGKALSKNGKNWSWEATPQN